VLVAPRPREVSFGRVAGWVSPGTRRIVVLAGDRAAASTTVTRRRFSLVVRLPPRDVVVSVVAYDGHGHWAARRVGPVFGLPPPAAPRAVAAHEDAELEDAVVELAEQFDGIASVFVEDLATGRGAAWNARARFPAASTLKLAVAVELLRRLRAPPPPGSGLDDLVQAMLVDSDNDAANAIEARLGGSLAAGAEAVDETLERVGLRDTHLYGGFLAADTDAIPLTDEAEPSFGVEKYTTAWDLARLAAWLHLAAAGRGPLVARLPGFTAADARYLLFVLAHSADHGKLDRYLGGGHIAVLHKAGWITVSRHDNGIVYWPGGAFVAAVLTWNGEGVGDESDELAGRIARIALDRFRALRRQPRADGAGARIAALSDRLRVT